MKFLWKIGLPSLCLCLMLTGCSLWMDGAYVSVTPNRADTDNRKQESVVVNSYQQMCDILAEMVEDGTQDSILYIGSMADDNAIHAVDSAIDYVCRMNPIGAYAVKEITYDIGTNTGKRAIAINISYNHNRSEILQIKNVQNVDGVLALIRVALDNIESGTVLKVKNYSAKDFTQFVEDYVTDNPHICMEMPQVTVSCYPEFGKERVVEITFTYQTSRETLRAMQESVSNVFKSAHLYVDPRAEASEKYSQLYSFLMERYDYQVETSITPSYSLLRHGVGDSRAFATVYAQMCSQAGLECEVISGTKAGEAWHWNLLKSEGQYFHLDLLECKATGFFAPKTDEEMAGYVWDFSAFE